MNPLIIFLCSCILSFLAPFAAVQADADLRSHRVLVSVAPHKFFVEKIAGNTVTVDLLVPAGASSHTYEPSPKQMLAASRADVWFQMGEFFEARASQAIQSHQLGMQFVDLRKGLDLIGSSDRDGGCAHCRAHGNGMDLHIWMSPKMAMTQAQTIAEALIQVYPEHREAYTKALHNFLSELDALDHEIAGQLALLKTRWILVSHPAYAYFCREYNLKQMSIEFEGKDPTAMQLTQILEKAKEANLHAIFIQKQYNNKGARLLAHQLGIPVVMLDPYAENYSESLREIARQFASTANSQAN